MTFRLESRNRLRVDAATGLRAFSGPRSSPAPRREEGDMAWLEQMLGDGDDDDENYDYVDLLLSAAKSLCDAMFDQHDIHGVLQASPGKQWPRSEDPTSRPLALRISFKQ